MVGIELQMINPAFFFQYLKVRCHGKQFCGKITYPYIYRCLSETEWDIALQIRALIAPLIALQRVKRW